MFQTSTKESEGLAAFSAATFFSAAFSAAFCSAAFFCLVALWGTTLGIGSGAVTLFVFPRFGLSEYCDLLGISGFCGFGAGFCCK